MGLLNNEGQMPMSSLGSHTAHAPSLPGEPHATVLWPSRDQAVGILAYLRSLRFFARQPRLSTHALGKLSQTVRGLDYGQSYSDAGGNASRAAKHEGAGLSTNPLRSFFESRQSGRGIWKWDHYFDIYHHHFARFVGTDINVLEIGIYSGGSLEMWRQYFGPRCHVYGVDIEDACKVYANQYTDIFVGDQEDRSFWKRFREQAPLIDIVIDDGGHSSQQQIVTLEELLPHLRPGGVYLCEDVHGLSKGFNSFAHGLVSNLNALMPIETAPGSVDGSVPTQFQRWISSIHFYPYVIVLEKAHEPVHEFASCKRGTEWQPFAVPGGVAPASRHG